MKKILFLMKFLKGGGAERVLLTILQNLDYEKYDISLCVLFKAGIYIDQIPKNVKFFYIFDKETPENHKWASDNAKELYSKYITETYDIEIAFLEGICTKIIATSPQCSRKIAWVHIDLFNCHYTNYLYSSTREEEETYCKYDQIVFVSKTVQDNFYKLFPKLYKRGIVIYNPIDIHHIIELSTEYSVIFDKTTFISIGRLTDQKGFDRLINATSRLIEHGFEFEVLILGEGPKDEYLKALVAQLQLQDVIKFGGFKSNPYPYLLAADVFISSSRSEGLALVLCEALVLKKEIIATNCSGVNEALYDGKYGLITDNSEDGIFSAMYKFLNTKMNHFISDSVTDPFSLEYSMKKIIELFD